MMVLMNSNTFASTRDRVVNCKSNIKLLGKSAHIDFRTLKIQTPATWEREAVFQMVIQTERV